MDCRECHSVQGGYNQTRRLRHCQQHNTTAQTGGRAASPARWEQRYGRKVFSGDDAQSCGRCHNLKGDIKASEFAAERETRRQGTGDGETERQMDKEKGRQGNEISLSPLLLIILLRRFRSYPAFSSLSRLYLIANRLTASTSSATWNGFSMNASQSSFIRRDFSLSF